MDIVRDFVGCPAYKLACQDPANDSVIHETASLKVRVRVRERGSRLWCCFWLGFWREDSIVSSLSLLGFGVLTLLPSQSINPPHPPTSVHT